MTGVQTCALPIYALLYDKGLMILKALSKNKIACANLHEIMSTLVERGETIEALEASLEEKGKIERDDAMEKASLEDALEEEQETRASLEEKLENIEESHNDIIAKIIKERWGAARWRWVARWPLRRRAGPYGGALELGIRGVGGR